MARVIAHQMWRNPRIRRRIVDHHVPMELIWEAVMLEVGELRQEYKRLMDKLSTTQLELFSNKQQAEVLKNRLKELNSRMESMTDTRLRQ